MSRFAQVDRVDIQIQGHTVPEDRKITYLYAFERTNSDAKLSVTLEPDIVEDIDYSRAYLLPKATGLIKRFILQGEGLEIRDPMPPAEPLEAIVLDGMYEASSRCERCNQPLVLVEYVTHTLAELVRAASEHLATCEPS